jgi:hypothetical protein
MTGRALIVAALAIAGAVPLIAQRGAPPPTRAKRGTASIAGRIVQSDGLAAEDARVAVYAVREGAAAAILGTATSAYDGRYEVTGLPAGEVMIGVTPQRLRGFGGETRRLPASPTETMYPGVSDRTRAQPITLFDGVAAEGIDVWLAPGQRFSIGGQVFWPAGVDVEDLVIEYGGRGDSQRGIWNVSDPRGLFTIENVSPGTYVLLARAETRDGPLLGLASTDVAIGAVEDVRVTLRRPGSLEGRLVFEGTVGVSYDTLHVTPEQLLLTLSPLYPTEEAAVDRSGRFELARLAGEYSLTVRGLPAGWRLRRMTRNGIVLANNRIAVHPGERVTGIEVAFEPVR